MANLTGFNASEVEPNEGFGPIPAGEYDAVIAASELKATKKGDGEYLKLELQVLNGQYQNRKLWENLNLKNPNQQAVDIAKATLSAICRAVKVLTPNDSAELHNKPLRIQVKVDKEGQNRITSFKPRHAGGAAAEPVAATNGPAPAADQNKAPW